MKLGNFEIPTEEIGDTWQLEGILIGNGQKTLAMLLPFETVGQGRQLIIERPSDEQWQSWLKQSDDPVTPVVTRASDKTLLKALVKKSSRQVDQSIVWRVYQRDNYTCRYCGNTGVPLTVDHYLAQKFGGETTYENLLAACRPCNKRKGHMTIDEWKEYCSKKGLKSF